MLTYQLLTGRFPFWDNVQNLTLQQARAVTCNACPLHHSPLTREACVSRSQPESTSHALCMVQPV